MSWSEKYDTLKLPLVISLIKLPLTDFFVTEVKM